ncbi:MAG: ornithine cyclodeaminase family protein [Actinomycetia bacterium]|nr:ornithine cyclodeaminase family protein [Actinomycetes bacterium]
MRYLDIAQTEAMLEPDSLREALGVAMAEVSAGRVSMPPRIAAQNPDVGGLMAVMPAYIPALGAMATKIVNVYPGNAGTEFPTHQAIVVLVEPDTGELLGMFDGDSITAARTAAGSALSTDLLARSDARVLCICGTGVQAHSHAVAVERVRPFDEIRIAGRSAEKAATLAVRLTEEMGRDVVAAAGFEDGCRGADVVCATTDASEPVVQRDWLAPGTHVTAVGFNAVGREIDTATVADALLVVETADTAFAMFPAGSNDLRIPLEEGAITADHVHAEIGELVSGTKPGRTSPEQLTLYKSVGVAAQDVAAAKLVHDRAIAHGAGIDLPR